MAFSTVDVFAQFTVESENKEVKQKVEFKPIQIKDKMNVETDYYSEAREKAERKRIRQERNALGLLWESLPPPSIPRTMKSWTRL